MVAEEKEALSEKVAPDEEDNKLDERPRERKPSSDLDCISKGVYKTVSEWQENTSRMRELRH